MQIVKQKATILNETPNMLTHLEYCGRTCYKSHERITEGSAERFCKMILKNHHESVLEHGSITVKIITDRAIANELVRHRIASYSQESTRYCVAGETKLKTHQGNKTITVKELYDNVQNSKNGAWKRMSFKQYNEETKTLQFSKINNVFYNGKRETIKITTRLGYELVCTKDHEILTPEGVYINAGDLHLQDKICVNGTDLLYKNPEWLRYQNITLNKTFVQIANEYGYNVSTLKKWARIHKLPKKGTGYFNVGHTPWNKGIQNEKQVEALKKYHHCGRRKDKILKEDTKRYQKRKKHNCEICGCNNDLIVHHIDENRENNFESNLITLCKSCHLRIHSKNLETVYADEIVSIMENGVIDVYDIEMKSEHHNYVANGIIVHNCNYNGEDIKFIEPPFKTKEAKAIWENDCKHSEYDYNALIRNGEKPEIARNVLPLSLATEIVATANIREWRNILKQRTAESAHPQMRELANLILSEFMATSYSCLFQEIV